MLRTVGAVLCIFLATVDCDPNTTVLPIPSDKLICSYLEQSLCRNTGYNQTAFPNARDHETQDEAASEMADFSPLWTGEIPCSNAIVPLLCSYYFPFCGVLGEDGDNITVAPCRNLCEAAREGCAQLIEENAGIGWPVFLECSNFPTQESGLCFGPSDPSILPLPNGTLTEGTDSPTSTTPTTHPSPLLVAVFFIILLFLWM